MVIMRKLRILSCSVKISCFQNQQFSCRFVFVQMEQCQTKHNIVLLGHNRVQSFRRYCQKAIFRCFIVAFCHIAFADLCQQHCLHGTASLALQCLFHDIDIFIRFLLQQRIHLFDFFFQILQIPSVDKYTTHKKTSDDDAVKSPECLTQGTCCLQPDSSDQKHQQKCPIDFSCFHSNSPNLFLPYKTINHAEEYHSQRLSARVFPKNIHLYRLFFKISSPPMVSSSNAPISPINSVQSSLPAERVGQSIAPNFSRKASRKNRRFFLASSGSKRIPNTKIAATNALHIPPMPKPLQTAPQLSISSFDKGKPY